MGIYTMDALQPRDSSVLFAPSDTTYFGKAKINYIEPYIGNIYSHDNKIVFINNKDNSGCVSGDLVTWTNNYIGSQYASEYKGEKYVKVKFIESCDLKKGDEFICFTKSPYLVNDKVKFPIEKCQLTKESVIDKSNWCAEAEKFMKSR